MANAVALNMKFIAETSSLTTGAKQTAKMLTQLGNDVVRMSQSFKQFANDNVAASKAQQDLTTDANLLASQLKNGLINADQFREGMEELTSAARKQSDAFAEGISLTASLATEEEKHTATVNRLNQLLDAGAISQETFSRAMENAESSLSANANAAKEHADVMARGERITQSVATQEEKYAAEVKDLEDMLSRGAISQDTFNRAVAKAAGQMKGSEKEADRLSDQIKKMSANLRTLVAIEFGKILAKGFSVAARAVSDIARNVASSVGELTKLAAISNTSVETFQGLATAAATVGIEHDKLADIFKDVGDRVGDFIQTGGGPMADFFENIAPKVGVTAEQFAKLSGPEALQLYVDSLQKAGLSQAEMTFYLEAMSSDLTMLLPLLQDGGMGFQELAERAERLGIVLSEDQTSAIKEMNGALGLVYATFEGIVGQVMGNLAPAVTAIAEEFLQFVEGYQGLGEGTGGTALADSITTALFDGAEYLADLLDSAIASLTEWGVNVENSFAMIESIFQFFYDAVVFLNDAFFFVRSVFNDFIAMISEWGAKFMSYFSSSTAEFLNNYAQLMRQQAEQDRQRMSQQKQAAQQSEGTFGGAVRTGRSAFESRNTPEAKAQREADRAAREAEKQKAEEARKEKKRQEELQRQAEEDAKKREAAEKKIADMREELASAEFQYAMKNAADLAKVNQQALKVSDIRSGGIDQVLALATGREDPAVEASRQQLRELQALRMSVEGLGQVVEIAGAA